MCRPTWDPSRLLSIFAYGAVTRYGPTSQTVMLIGRMSLRGPATPSSKPDGLGSSAFVRIPGSMLVCSSPRLFAACHVLLRLLMPRHPSCALCSLTTKIFLILMSFLRRILQFFVSTFSALTKLLFACLYGFHFIFPTFLTSLFVNDHRACKSARFFRLYGGRTWI